MCIRDSADLGAGAAVARLPGQRRGRGRPAAGAQILPLCRHCLLYTSDAADERSSVDLGGRRIIKKTK